MKLKQVYNGNTLCLAIHLTSGRYSSTHMDVDLVIKKILFDKKIGVVFEGWQTLSLLELLFAANKSNSNWSFELKILNGRIIFLYSLLSVCKANIVWPLAKIHFIIKNWKTFQGHGVSIYLEFKSPSEKHVNPSNNFNWPQIGSSCFFL